MDARVAVETRLEPLLPSHSPHKTILNRHQRFVVEVQSNKMGAHYVTETEG